MGQSQSMHGKDPASMSFDVEAYRRTSKSDHGGCKPQPNLERDDSVSVSPTLATCSTDISSSIADSTVVRKARQGSSTSRLTMDDCDFDDSTSWSEMDASIELSAAILKKKSSRGTKDSSRRRRRRRKRTPDGDQAPGPMEEVPTNIISCTD